MKIWKFLTFLLIIISFVFSGCDEDENEHMANL
jgi:predicted small secreted protein